MSFRRMRHVKPREVQGCQLALDASIPSSLWDATSGGNLVGAGGSVARWEDQSGNARHATQSTSANRPTRQVAAQGGSDGVRFDGVNDIMTYATGGSDPNTIVVAVRWRDATQTGYRTILSWGNSSGIANDNGGALLLMRNSTRARFATFSYNALADRESSYTTTESAFVGSQTDPGNGAGEMNWRVNSQQQGSWTTPTTFSGDNWGRDIGGSTWNGGQNVNMDLFNVCVWDRALSVPVINRLHAAAMRKWRIAA